MADPPWGQPVADRLSHANASPQIPLINAN
jgi:hypothetical protein